jgi:hypothetical protein
METLRRQIHRAQRRLILQSLAGKLAWCWCATLSAATIAIGAGKLWPIVDDRIWALGCIGTALGLGALVALTWTWARRPGALEAAVEIDRRYGLKERVSSALALDHEQSQTPIGRALVADAQARVKDIDVADRFRFLVDRRAALPLAPAAAAFVLAVLVGVRTAQPPAEASAAQIAQVKRPAEALAKKLEEGRKEAAEKGLKDADLILMRLEEAAKNLAEKNTADRKQTLVALNDLAKQAEQRRKELVGGAELKQQLAQLKNLEQGPAQKLGRALKTGDLPGAIKELDKLKEQLAGDKLDPQAREALTRQLEQMREALENKVKAHKEAQDALKAQIAAERRAGNMAAAEKLERQMEKLAAQMPQVDKLNQMAQQLSRAGESMKRGDAKQAADALAQLSEQLEGMQQEMQELEMLDGALDQVADCKNAMACKECNGEGCAACQGEGNKLGDKWSRTDMARGGGIGAGKRPESKNDTSFYDSQVKQNVGKGASIVTGQAEGPNRKGQVQEQIKLDLSAAEQQTAEALSGQRLPRDYRDHAKKYFDSLREGQR